MITDFYAGRSWHIVIFWKVRWKEKKNHTTVCIVIVNNSCYRKSVLHTPELEPGWILITSVLQMDFGFERFWAEIVQVCNT